MDGATLSDLIDELNGGAPIGTTLKFHLVNAFKGILEQERPWVILRRTDTSQSVTASNTWQTAIDLSGITNFSRFHGERPVKLFDGNNTISAYRQVPIENRLEHKDTPNTFVYDEFNKTLYLNGTPSFAGVLWIRHLVTTADLDVNSTATAWPFPSWSHPTLAFGAVAIHKGGVDYDEVNARQLIQNNADAARIYSALVKWDSNKQLSEREEYDPRESSYGPTPNAIDLS